MNSKDRTETYTVSTTYNYTFKSEFNDVTVGYTDKVKVNGGIYAIVQSVSLKGHQLSSNF